LIVCVLSGVPTLESGGNIISVGVRSMIAHTLGSGGNPGGGGNSGTCCATVWSVHMLESCSSAAWLLLRIGASAVSGIFFWRTVTILVVVAIDLSLEPSVGITT